MVKVIVLTGWFKVPHKDQYIVSRLAPTREHPRRFEAWFARDTMDEVEKTLAKRCERRGGYQIVNQEYGYEAP